MRLRNFKLSVLFTSLSLFAFNQEIKDASVITEMHLGQQHYYILNETGTENFYKTSPNDLILNNNQFVQLRFNQRPDDMVEIIVPAFNEFLLARKIDVPVGGISPRLEFRLPKQVNDILFFESEKHIAEVHDLMTNYLATAPIKDVNIQNKLNLIENKFSGFVSYRQWFENKYDIKNDGFTALEITKMEKEDFINDDILKTFFNSRRFLGIKDSIYYYHEEGVILRFQKDNAAALAFVTDVSLTQDNNGYDVFQTDFNFQTQYTIEIISSKGGSLLVPEKGITIVTPILSYQSIPNFVYFAGSCQPLVKGLYFDVLRVILAPASSSDYDLGSISTTLTIQWGDGNTTVTNNYTGQTIYHTYPTSGIFHPLTTISFVDDNGYPVTLVDGTYSSGSPIEFNTSLTCSEDDKSLSGEVSSGNWKMTTEIWVNHNVFGHHIGAKTHAWK